MKEPVWWVPFKIAEKTSAAKKKKTLWNKCNQGCEKSSKTMIESNDDVKS